MDRNRTINASLWSDPTVGELSIAARLLFIGMFSQADDEGRIEFHPLYLRRLVFGYDAMSVAEVTGLMDEIRRICRSVEIYTVDGREVAVFRKWSVYQHIDRPTRSFLPDPPDYSPEPRVIDQRMPRNNSGHIYVIRSGLYHKIGLSRRPEGRMRELGVQMPHPIEVIFTAAVDDMFAHEASLHARFANKRLNGEWFELTDEDIDAIRSMYSSVQ